MVMMLGIMGGFVYGAGFRVEQRWLRVLVCPAVTWPVMLVSAVALLVMK